MRWTKEDFEYLFYLLVIVIMILLIPAAYLYGWLQHAENRDWLIRWLTDYYNLVIHEIAP